MGLSGFVQELGIPYTGIDGISMYDNEQLPPCHWESEWPRCSPSVLLNCWECKCPQASILYQEIMPGNLHLSQLQKNKYAIFYRSGLDFISDYGKEIGDLEKLKWHLGFQDH